MASVYLELFRERPPDSWDDPGRQGLCIGWGYAFPLSNAAHSLPDEIQARFPLLWRVDLRELFHGHQRVLLTPDEVSELLAEFGRIREIYVYRRFEPGLDSESFR